MNCSRTGGLTVTELAGRVGLSFSPWHRHLRALEQSGAISGYHAHLDAVPGDPDYLSSGLNLCSCGPLQLCAQAAEFGVDRLRTGASQRVLLGNREVHVCTRQQYLVALSNP